MELIWLTQRGMLYPAEPESEVPIMREDWKESQLNTLLGDLGKGYCLVDMHEVSPGNYVPMFKKRGPGHPVKDTVVFKRRVTPQEYHQLQEYLVKLRGGISK
jgi:hypothetical protein